MEGKWLILVAFRRFSPRFAPIPGSPGAPRTLAGVDSSRFFCTLSLRKRGSRVKVIIRLLRGRVKGFSPRSAWKVGTGFASAPGQSKGRRTIGKAYWTRRAASLPPCASAVRGLIEALAIEAKAKSWLRPIFPGRSPRPNRVAPGAAARFGLGPPAPGLAGYAAPCFGDRPFARVAKLSRVAAPSASEFWRPTIPRVAKLSLAVAGEQHVFWRPTIPRVAKLDGFAARPNRHHHRHGMVNGT